MGLPEQILQRKAAAQLHPDFSRIVIEGPLAFQFDLRLVARLQWKVCGILVSEPANPDFSHADKVKGWGWRRPVNARDQLEDEAY